VPQVNVLLGIMTVKVDIVRWTTEVEGARHARVAVRDIQAAGVTRVPIIVTLDCVQIGDFLSPLAGALLSHHASKHTARRSDGMGLCCGGSKLTAGMTDGVSIGRYTRINLCGGTKLRNTRVALGQVAVRMTIPWVGNMLRPRPVYLPPLFERLRPAPQPPP
jgi:hypothetical protein